MQMGAHGRKNTLSRIAADTKANHTKGALSLIWDHFGEGALALPNERARARALALPRARARESAGVEGMRREGESREGMG